MSETTLLFLAAVLALVFGERTRDEIFCTAGVAWRGANETLQRWVSVPMLLWVLAILTGATYRWEDGTMLFILITPILLLITAFALWPAVLVAVVAAYNKSTNMKAAVNSIGRGLAWVMFVGVILRIVPVQKDPTYALGAGIFMTILGLWALGGEAYWSIIIKRWGSRLLVTMVVLVIAVLFAGGREEAKALAAKVLGQIPSITLPTLSSPPAPATKPAAGTLPPICDGAGGDIELSMDNRKSPEIPLRTGCLSARIKLPPDDVGFRVDNPSMKGYEYFFMSGERVSVTEDGTWIGLKTGRSSFRLRGINGEGRAIVTIRPL